MNMAGLTLDSLRRDIMLGIFFKIDWHSLTSTRRKWLKRMKKKEAQLQVHNWKTKPNRIIELSTDRCFSPEYRPMMPPKGGMCAHEGRDGRDLHIWGRLRVERTSCHEGKGMDNFVHVSSVTLAKIDFWRTGNPEDENQGFGSDHLIIVCHSW